MRNLVIVATMVAVTFLSACNTIEGAGRDMSSAGKAITETAKDAKN